MKQILLLFIILLVSACGQNIEGTYVGEKSGMSYTFQSDGYVTVTTGFGIALEVPYELDGNKIKIEVKGATFVLTRQEDGSITGGVAGGEKLFSDSSNAHFRPD